VAIDQPPQKHDQIIDGGGGLLIPGLINAHDHLELNTFKRLKYRDRYHHSIEWIEDIEARFNLDADLITPRQQPLGDRLLIGALKNLLSGVTTVCHHNQLYRQLRARYPIRVVKRYGFCHSFFRGDDPGKSYRKTNASYPWIIHLAEGVDDRAAAEFDQLVDQNLLQNNTVLVHGVGLTASQRQQVVEQGAGLIWCPGSNIFMFGQTAQVEALAKAKMLALGSDSRLSGEPDLLAELRVAQATGQISPQNLFESVTSNPAQMLGLTRYGVGSLQVGGFADLLLLPAATHDPLSDAKLFLQLLSLKRAQIQLVMLAGKPLVASPDLKHIFDATKTKATLAIVDHTEKLMVRPLAARLRRSLLAEPGVFLAENRDKQNNFDS
jgi:cytosine/adenosine deaminase-related metal-dependent hydrolase